MFEYESASMDPRSSSFHRNEYTIQLQFWLTIALLNFIIVNTHVSCRPSTTFLIHLRKLKPTRSVASIDCKNRRGTCLLVSNQ